MPKTAKTTRERKRKLEMERGWACCGKDRQTDTERPETGGGEKLETPRQTRMQGRLGDKPETDKCGQGEGEGPRDDWHEGPQREGAPKPGLVMAPPHPFSSLALWRWPRRGI